MHPRPHWRRVACAYCSLSAIVSQFLQRSPHDDAVMFRRQKQYQFAMQDVTVPRTQRFDPTGWW